MKNLYSFVFAVAASTVIGSCSINEVETVETGFPDGDVTVDGIPFVAVFEQTESDGGQRTQLNGENGHVILWNKGDAVKIWDSDFHSGRFTADKDGVNTLFEKAEVDEGFVAGNATYAFYPENSVQSIDGSGVITFVIPETQTYVENSFGKDANYAVSRIETKYAAGGGNRMYKELSFTNVAGLLKLNLYCSSETQPFYISRIVLRDNSQNICGTFSVDASAGKPAAQYVGNGGNTITLECGVKGILVSSNPDKPTSFYITVPVGASARNSGFVAEVYNRYDHLVARLRTSNPNGSSTIRRSYITDMQSRECVWLPKTCKEYDFLKSQFVSDPSDGSLKSQFINTGINLSDGVRIQMRGTMDGTSTTTGDGNPAFCGLVNTSSGSPWMSIDYKTDMEGVRACLNGTSAYSSPKTGVGSMVECDVRFFTGANGFKGSINGTGFENTVSGNLPSGSNFLLFAEGVEGDDGKACAENISSCSIYSFIVYDKDDEIIRNFIPVTAPEGNGMWDMAEGRFYGPCTENPLNGGEFIADFIEAHVIPEVDPTLVFSEFDIDGAELLDFNAKKCKISLIMHYGTDLTRLKANFTHNADKVFLGDQEQISGVTEIDFSSPVTFTLKTREGFNDWTVSVETTEEGDINKYLEMKSFVIPEIGGAVRIDGSLLYNAVKSGVNKASLVPVFTTNAQRVLVGSTEQTSGVTANNFNSDVIYRLESKVGHRDITVQTLQFTIPAIFITTSKEVVSKDDWVKKSSMIIFDNSTGKIDTLGVPSGSDNIAVNQIKGRGNSTWGFPKKPYTLKLDKKSSVLGMPADKRWNLLANWMDRTDMRNEIAFELARRSPGLDWTPRGRFVELYMNGDYNGNYYLCEHIKVSTDRVNISSYDEDAPVAANEIGYLLEFDTNYDEVNKFHTSKGLPVNIKDPDAEGLDPSYVNYIKEWVDALETMLNSASTSSDYRNYLDIDSYIDWYLVHEMTNIYEPNHPKSTYMYKDAETAADNKIHAGPCWDFDYDTFNEHRSTSWSLRDEEKAGIWRWYKYLFADPTFKARLKTKWNAQKSSYRDVADNYIPTIAGQIKASVGNDKTRWPCTSGVNGDKDLSFDEAVGRLKQYLNVKIDWMDRQISNY